MGKTLCQLLAPILVFTTDELWRSFPFGKESSVHEAIWDEKIWNAYDQDNLRRWNAIRIIRKNSDSVIEKLREKKEIGSPLDCRVILTSAKPEVQAFLTENQNELTLGLIVSSVDNVVILTSPLLNI